MATTVASATSAPAPTASSTQAATATHGGSLRLGIPTDITGLDGHLIAAPATDTLWQVFDRLTVYNAKLEPQPMLAESWSLNSDGTQLTLNLGRASSSTRVALYQCRRRLEPRARQRPEGWGWHSRRLPPTAHRRRHARSV